MQDFRAPTTLRADGGVSRSDFVLQTISTLTGAAVQRTQYDEVTSLGACYLAGLAAGVWRREDLSCRPGVQFSPQPQVADALQPVLELWRTAVQRACAWPRISADGKPTQ